METKEERLAREQKHFKKQLKKLSNHKKNKIKRMLTEQEEKNWRNKLLNGEME